MVTLTCRDDGPVFVCDLGDDENRLDSERIRSINTVLDEVDRTTGPAAIVTVGGGRFYSNGLEPASFAEPGYLDSFQSLLRRILVSSTPTVAALQGHTYAGGLLLALAHDERIMRLDRGFACLPEAQIGFPFADGMSAHVRSRLAPPVAHQAMVTSHRYVATEAESVGLVDSVATEDELLAAAVARAAHLAPLRGDHLGAIKLSMYSEAAAALSRKVPV